MPARNTKTTLTKRNTQKTHTRIIKEKVYKKIKKNVVYNPNSWKSQTGSTARHRNRSFPKVE